jgi:sugar O-acyltransferase (sialic acid O-acetyltransferase NeuD family)
MKKQRLFVIGAGGFGREVYCWLRQTPEWDKLWRFAGFLTENEFPPLPKDFPGSVVGHPLRFDLIREDQIVIAIGDSAARLRIAAALRDRGVSFPVVRHPSSIMGFGCHIGAGCILCPGTVITTNVTLEDFVIVNLNSTIGHDVRVGAGTTLSCHVDITGGAEIGEGVFMGSHASVLPRAKIGAFAKVGAGSVVLRSVAAGATVMGVPAKQILP